MSLSMLAIQYMSSKILLNFQDWFKNRLNKEATSFEICVALTLRT